MHVFRLDYQSGAVLDEAQGLLGTFDFDFLNFPEAITIGADPARVFVGGRWKPLIGALNWNLKMIGFTLPVATIATQEPTKPGRAFAVSANAGRREGPCFLRGTSRQRGADPGL